MHSDKVIIQRAVESDIPDIIEARRTAILEKAGSHYDQEHVILWSNEGSSNRAEKLKQQINGTQWLTFIAKAENRIIGFGQINCQENTFGALYVKKNSYGQVGRQLLEQLVHSAKEYGVKFLEMEASVNAEAFYRAAGFKTMEHTKHVMSSDTEMACVKMRLDF